MPSALRGQQSSLLWRYTYVASAACRQEGWLSSCSVESPAVAATIAWLTHRMVDFFRHDTPLAATWKAPRFLSVIAVKTALLCIVLNGLWILAALDFADEIPQILFLRFELTGYLCLGAGIIIGLVWIVRAKRRGHTSNVVRQALMQVLLGAVTVLLLLPILMAYLQVSWSISLLDCSRRGIPGYVPDMIDYTRLILDSLAGATLFGLKSAFGWQVATCAPLATSYLASLLVYALNLAPIILLSLLAYRFHRSRDDRHTASSTT